MKHVQWSDYYVYRCVFIAQLSYLFSATTMTWSSPMESKFKNLDDNPLGRVINDTEESLLASIPTIAAGIGSLFYGVLSRKFGRKTLLLSLGLPYIIFNLVMAWSTTIWLFYISRFFTGFGMGAVSTILPMYCGELAAADNRGILGTSMAVFVNIGMLIPYSVGPFCPFFFFQIILASLPLIYLPLFYFCAPESPSFVIQFDSEKAVDILKRLRGNRYDKEEVEDIKKVIHKSEEGSILEIINSKSLRKALGIAFGLIVFQQMTGNGVIVQNTQKIFGMAGFETISPEVCPIIIGMAQLATTVITSSIADKFRRKVLLTISYAGVAIMLLLLGIYFVMKDDNIDVSSIGWIPLVSLALYFVSYNIGIGPILFTLFSELFPPKVKGTAISYLVLYQFAGIFALSYLFNTLTDLIGLGYLMLVFAATSFVAIIFIQLVVIETKGKTLIEIQDELNR